MPTRLMTDRQSSPISRRGAGALLVIALAAVLMLGRPATAQSTADGVRLIIDYGDGISKTIDNLPWSAGNTVLDVLKEAASRPHGISFTYAGSGASAVLSKIDDVQNQGGGPGKKNWQYWVDGRYGDRSFAAFEVKAGDVVTWRFTSEQGQ